MAVFNALRKGRHGISTNRGKDVTGQNRARPQTVVFSRRLPAAVEARAAETYTLRANPQDLALDAAELAERCQGAEALVVCPADRLSAATIAALPATLRIIGTFSVGTDHIDLDSVRARGWVVINTPDVLTDATADLAILLMLAAARRAGEGERLVRAGPGVWTGWAPTQLLGLQVTGKRLGILGMGRIGQAVAARARAFGMIIHYSNRRRLPPQLEQGAVFHADPDDLLSHADFFSLHCPATAETRGWLNAERIARLPDNAVVINTARGAVVSDDALIQALASGRLFAAGLDVFEGEPNLRAEYRDLPNAVLLPHLGSATIETRNAMGFKALDNLDAFFAGREPPDRVV